MIKKDDKQSLGEKPEVEMVASQLPPPPSDFSDIDLPARSKGTPIEEAAKNDWFLAGKCYEVGTRIEMPVVRTNNEAAIPPAAVAELEASPMRRPAQDSQYWEKLNDAPSFHTPGAPKEFGSWRSTAYALKENPEVVILCHQEDVP